MSIIIVLSGSPGAERSPLNAPLCSHVHAVETCACSLPCARRPKNDHTAPPKATKTLVVEIQPAAARGLLRPSSGSAPAPASGANKHSHAPVLIRAAPRGGRRRARGCGG